MSYTARALTFCSVVALCLGRDRVQGSEQELGSLLTNGNNSSALVLGEVTAVDSPPDQAAQATIKVVRVYSGSKPLKGTTFPQSTADEGSNNGRVAMPLLKVGEVGLWVMDTDQNTGNPIWSPYSRKSYAANYARKLEWAEAIERLVEMKVGERLKAAKELCECETPEVAELGVEVLLGADEVDAERAEIPRFIKGLPKNKAATVSALVRADSLFTKEHRKKWVDSEERKAYLERFTDAMTEANAEFVADHIIRARSIQSPDGNPLTEEQATTMLGKIATDPRQPKAVQCAIVRKVVEIRSDCSFNVLVAVVRNGSDDAVRLQAVAGLDRHARAARPPIPTAYYPPAKLEVLRGLLKDEKSPEVAKALRTSLERTK
jgi:hypothetical protein